MAAEMERSMLPRRRFFDLFDLPELVRWFEPMRPVAFDERIKVEEEIHDGALVVRAELPGIDPDKDVEVVVRDGLLTIAAERSREAREEGEGTFRSEFHYGSFTRTLQLPEGITPDDVTASYADGILEVRVPMPAPTPEPGSATRVLISRSWPRSGRRGRISRGRRGRRRR
jgi:HSP20 family protein